MQSAQSLSSTASRRLQSKSKTRSDVKMIFLDRATAGRELATRLKYLRGQNIVVLGLPRGGVPVAFQVAKELNAPLDVIIVRKLGVPSQPELAMGAVSEGGVLVTNPKIVRMAHVSKEEFSFVEDRERREVAERARRFRGGTPALSLSGRIALIVDDGIATGSTAQAACQVARALGAVKVLLAVPVGSVEAVELLKGDADEVISLQIPEVFFAVGEWYQNFSATSDDEVSDLLEKARKMYSPKEHVNPVSPK
jgi:putative phosphoribosyl transferase